MTEPGSPLVLVVDDDVAFLSAAEKWLRREGFRVLTAASGDQALELAHQLKERIAAVVMDIFLPDAWGSSLAFTLQQSQREMQVIYVSGFAETDPVLKDFRDPDVLLLSKPFEFGDLVAELRRRLA